MSRQGGQMIPEEEARRIVLEKATVLGTEEVFLAEAVGAVLAEEVVSDIDMPPFNRAAMDGYAVRSADVQAAPVELTVIEQVKAGDVGQNLVGPGQCSEIMTGAPVPEGADAVVKVEDTEPVSGGRVRILRSPGRKTNIARQGEDLHRGDTVLEPGRLLRPSEVGLLGMVGRGLVTVHRRPEVAVLATGDELVEPEREPAPGQTRNCNNASLLAECRRVGVRARSLGIARDTREQLEERIRAGLEADVLLVTGGVSMGKFDLVPQILESLGVEIHFTRVGIKPGKPTTFATTGRKLVFCLPGNPVAVIVTFRLFVEPALAGLAGRGDVLPRMAQVKLGSPLRPRGDRRAYLAVRVERRDGELVAEPVPSHGSADLMALSKADALVRVEPGASEVAAGTSLAALLLEM